MDDSPSLKDWKEQQGLISKLYAHDFKNPISAMSANISYLEAMLGDADEDVRGAISDSAVAMRMLLHMVENFLQISRLEAGESFTASEGTLSKFVSDALARCLRLNPVSEPAVAIEGRIPDATYLWPAACANLIIDNLILTALHHTGSRGRVRLSIAVKADTAIFTCTDDGYPISPEFYDRSFTREFQAQAKGLNTARYGRAMAMYAIGLAVETMGGRAKISSGGIGQTIEIALPLNAVSK